MLKILLRRYFCVVHSSGSLLNRSIIDTTDLTTEEYNLVICTAEDLSTNRPPQNCYSYKGKTMTLLLDHPYFHNQTCAMKAANFWNISLNTVIEKDWDNRHFPEDHGKLVSLASDIIFGQSERHLKLQKFAQGSSVPVVNIGSCRFSLIHVLSDLLTIKKHFGYLDGVTLAWIGRICPMINTYLTVAPKLGIKLNFICECGGPVSPTFINFVESQSDAIKSKVKECKSLEETIKGANVIATGEHHEKSLRINFHDLERGATKDWIFFHTMPRSEVEVEDKVFNSKKNLSWESFQNKEWIFATLIKLILAGN